MADPVKPKKGSLIGLHPNIVSLKGAGDRPLYEMEPAPTIKAEDVFEGTVEGINLTPKGASALFGHPSTVLEFNRAMRMLGQPDMPKAPQKSAHNWHSAANEAIRNRLGALGAGLGPAAGLLGAQTRRWAPGGAEIGLDNPVVQLKDMARKEGKRFENPKWDPSTELRINQLYKMAPHGPPPQGTQRMFVPFPGGGDHGLQLELRDKKEQDLLRKAHGAFVREMMKREI